MYTLERTQRLPISIEEAWKFFQSPENLAVISPDSLGFNILSETPDEMYLGKGGDVPGKLEASRKKARKERIETNRKRTCRACERPVAIAS